MTSPALICPTCRAAFDLAAAAESNAPLRDCCFAAIKVAMSHCIVADAAQTLVRAIARARPVVADLSDEAITNPDPQVRAAAAQWRFARGRNRETETWVHVTMPNAEGKKWLCGAENPEELVGVTTFLNTLAEKKITCPYCLGARLLRAVPT